MKRASTTVVVADASVLINLIHINRLDLLGALEGLTFVTTAEVTEEISDPAQAKLLGEALEEGYLRQEFSTDPDELSLYADLRSTLGRGEAACLAMAEHRTWMIACDERRAFLRQARNRLGEGSVINTPGLILMAIRRRKLSVADADEMKRLLETRSFKMTFDSFGDLV